VNKQYNKPVYGLGLISSEDSAKAATTESNSLDSFLASVQNRGFAMAKAAIGRDADALDVVQDAMLQLVKRYRDRTSDEWRMLFFRILQNRINDFFRRKKVRDKATGWLPRQFKNADEQVTEDPFQQVVDARSDTPLEHLERSQNIEHIHRALQTLSRRQREAFMLRCWEGLSTAETSAVMQCSEGSVKTHYSRAMESMRRELTEKD
jgi:RNA polymerase sigma-70 factor, ECF subfamily